MYRCWREIVRLIAQLPVRSSRYCVRSVPLYSAGTTIECTSHAVNMFKRFSTDDGVSRAQVKSSIQRGIRNKVLEQYPDHEEEIENILPKKAPMIVAKCPNHVQIVICNDTPLFFSQRDGPFLPTLRLLHQYPDMLPTVTVDRGGIPYVLSGANIMCPGVTSKGGRVSDGLEKGDAVAIMAEGKESAMAVGYMRMSTEDIRNINKGHGIENAHYLGDGLWQTLKIV